MNFKVITYHCGCKYVFVTDPDKQILKAHKFCPSHGKLKKHVMLWCQDCGLEMTETGLLAWQRKKRCLKCAKLNQKKRTLENWRKKAKKYNAKRRVPKPQHVDFRLAKRMALRKLYKSMDEINMSFKFTREV